ncbi:hypothetical protein AVEN_13145-1 [Araneus ventricosus]|uniref:Uncharacterized protein n=1 Tax=Araneus ventricosus TaxID=182803 RepID=A0A4Y2KZI5_ARAVE|nr:hypothetical protein AVEN_13145-1 [Araneus ventricosus]
MPLFSTTPWLLAPELQLKLFEADFILQYVDLYHHRPLIATLHVSGRKPSDKCITWRRNNRSNVILSMLSSERTLNSETILYRARLAEMV